MVQREPSQAVLYPLALSWCAMVSEAKSRGVPQKIIDYAKQLHTPYCWLPAKVMYPMNSTKRFFWLTRLIRIFNVEERSNIRSIYRLVSTAIYWKNEFFQ